MPYRSERWFPVLCSLAIVLAAACGGGSRKADPGGNTGDAGTSSDAGTLGDAGSDSDAGSADAGDGGTPAVTAEVSATVIDSLGAFVTGAQLISGVDSATTGADGRATLHVEVGSEQAVHIAKDGFAEQVKVLDLAAGAGSGTLFATLIAREAPQTIASIESGGSASGRDGVKVTFPPGALVDGNGQTVTGAVQMLMTPVNVADPVADAFPGLFEGMPETGPRTHIVSYGTAELVPQQNGKKLNLGAGRTALIELPLYVDKHQDGTPAKAGDTIPLWSLDVASGLWIQEGSGTVVASVGSPTGLALRATVGHFSWWNADVSTTPATVNLTVDVPGQTVPANTPASVGARVVGGSGPGFGVSTVVKVNQAPAVSLLVPAPATTRFSGRASLPGLVCTGTIDVAAGKGAVIDVTLHLDTCVTAPVPFITRPLDPTATNSQSPVVVDIALTGPQPDSVELFADGTSIARFPAQFFYRAFWDISSLSEGDHTLVATATLNGAATDSQPVTVVVDRTPPLLVSLTPPPGSTVRTSTVFTLQLNEPVNAGPFALTDAVKLAVTPLGSSTPVAVPATIAFTSAVQDTLTIQAQQPLPPGAAVSLAWGGLRDAAGNLVSSTVVASYDAGLAVSLGDVPVTAPVFGPSLPIAVTSGGKLMVAWRESNGDLVVARRDGDSWTPLGLSSENHSAAHNVQWTLALDASDVPYLAYSKVVSPSDDQIVVRRFNGSAWQSVGPAFNPADGVIVGGLHVVKPQLAFDGQNRPLVSLLFQHTSASGTVRADEVFRFDEAGGSWQSIGVPTLQPASALQTALVTLPNGDVVFAWEDDSATGQLLAQLQASRYDGNGWSSLGVIDSSPDELEGSITLAAGESGLWVSYAKFTQTVEHPRSVGGLAHLNGSSWDIVDIPLPQGTDSADLSLALQGDVPVVVQRLINSGVGPDFIAQRFAGGVWESAHDVTPPTPPNNTSAALPRLAAGGGAVFLSTRTGFPKGQLQQLVFP